MTEEKQEELYVTVSMAEILLAQNMVQEAGRVIAKLKKTEPDNPRIAELATRLEEMKELKSSIIPSPPSCGIDRVFLFVINSGLGVEWELTETGLAIAKRAAKYSGRPVVRLFTATAGPRGVRTQLRDLDLPSLIGSTVVPGMPRSSVHVAAVGYLANTGLFVSSAQSASLKVDL